MNGISAHGTQIQFNGTPISDLGEVTPPSLTRKAVSDDRRVRDDDEYKMGIRRKGAMSFVVPFLALSDEFLDAWESDTNEAYIITFADGAEWSFVGKVFEIIPSTKDALTCVVHVQPIGTITFSSPAPEVGSLLQESGGHLLQEDGSRLVW